MKMKIVLALALCAVTSAGPMNTGEFCGRPRPYSIDNNDEFDESESGGITSGIATFIKYHEESSEFGSVQEEVEEQIEPSVGEIIEGAEIFDDVPVEEEGQCILVPDLEIQTKTERKWRTISANNED